MKLPTRQLEDLALDYAVALVDPVCEGLTWEMIDGLMCGRFDSDGVMVTASFLARSVAGPHGSIRAGIKHPDARRYSPHLDWLQCGQLMDKFDLELVKNADPVERFAAVSPAGVRATGHTRQVAVVRCVALMTHGEEVEVPEGLVRGLSFAAAS